MENIMEILQKIKSRTVVWSNDVTSGSLYTMGLKSESQRDFCTLMFITALLANSQDMETT